MAVVNICRPTTIKTNKWCIKDMFALGEGTDLIMIPAPSWGQLKQYWLSTPAGAEASGPNILVPAAGVSLMEYIYTAPTTTPETKIIPSGYVKDGLFFSGDALIFNPTVGNAMEANGVPYQSSTFSLPVGSDRNFDELVQYILSKAWNLIKLNHDNSELHVYGGPRGYFPTADEISEMMFSGNNDAKGETQVGLTVDKANYAIEYIKAASGQAASALVDLFGYLNTGVAIPNGEEAPAV